MNYRTTLHYMTGSITLRCEAKSRHQAKQIFADMIKDSHVERQKSMKKKRLFMAWSVPRIKVRVDKDKASV